MVQGPEATEERLLGILYRFDCPSPLTIGEYFMDLLAEPSRTELARHLCGCGLCNAELRAYGAFLADDLRLEA